MEDGRSLEERSRRFHFATQAGAEDWVDAQSHRIVSNQRSFGANKGRLTRVLEKGTNDN